VGETLKELGFAPVLQAKTGHVEFDMTWAGLQRRRLGGGHGPRAGLAREGTNRRLETWGGRVLGLASVAELPRRLALDFSDLTDKGFAFDTARGHFDLRSGSAYTDDVVVKARRPRSA